MEKPFKTFIFEPTDLVPIEQSWDWQQEWQKMLLADPLGPQALWLLQHENCYTLGQGANESNLLFDLENPPAKIYRLNRGGEVTQHLPGQLVAYLVLDLKRYQTDLDWYLRQLEETLIDVLKLLDLVGERIEGLTGLWIEGKKVASIGIGGRRWITQHGLALNINCDLSGFSQIVPCGIRGKEVARLDYWIPGLKVSDVQPLIRRSFVERFDLNLTC